MEFTPYRHLTCAFVVLTHFSFALRAKNAYAGGGYEFPRTRKDSICPFLHAEGRCYLFWYGVNCNSEVNSL